MSKKFEAIKKAVFFSKENPKELASLLEGLFTDTLTSISVEGADSVVIPKSDSVTEEYTAKALSQFGDEMSEETVTLALNASVTGVSISGTTVTVTSQATADSFVIKATSGSVTALKTVKLVAGE